MMDTEWERQRIRHRTGIVDGPSASSPAPAAADRVMSRRVPEPTNIEVDREHGLTVEWDDGHGSHFGLEELRLNCPCAECRGLRQRDVVVWPRAGAPEVLRIETAELVGGYGLGVVWNDTHGTGIYSWETLRTWCHCPVCAPE